MNYFPPYNKVQLQDPTVSTQIALVDSSGRVTANQGAAAQASGAWMARITDGTNFMPTGDVASRALFYRLTDGTNTAGVDSTNHLYVAGKSAVGTAPSSNPVFISGIDTGGLKRGILTTVSGRTITVRQDESGNSTPAGDVASRAVFQRITDGTQTVTAGNITTAAVGLNTLNLGVYKAVLPTLTDGQVHPLRLDPTGALIVLPIQDASAKTLALSYSATFNFVAGYVGNYYPAINYVVPSGYRFIFADFRGIAGDNRNTIRASKFISMGSFNISTSAFVDGSSYPSPLFANTIEAEVTTAIAGNTTITVTYVNQSGVGGRTGTVVLTNGTPVGYRFTITLQAGDFGVRDVTNVTRAGGNSGAIAINGLVEMIGIVLDAANKLMSYSIHNNMFVAFGGETVAIDFSANGGSNVSRIITLVGSLTTTG